MMRQAVPFVIACLSLAPLPAVAGGIEAADVFESLKKLEGRWEGTAAGEEGHVHEIRVSANGSVVMETMMPDTDHEMINMYHLDGDELLLTHYCAAGNQPTMRLDREASGQGDWVFDFTGGTNFDPATDPHIHASHISIEDGRLVSRWEGWAEGKKAHEMTFDLGRAED